MKISRLLLHQLCLAIILCMALPYFLDSPAIAALNLEVPLEMVDQGLAALSGTGASNFQRSSIYLDPSDYDGATYYFEIVARNTDSTARSVYLRSSTTDYATIVVPAGTVGYTRFGQATHWTPVTGKSLYLARLDRTSSADQLIVQSARIVVRQTNATKTRIQIPLAQMGHDGYQAGFGWVDGTTSTAYSQGNSDYYSVWRKDSSRYADLNGTNPWTLEAALYNTGATATAYAALFNRSSGLQVAGAEISVTGSTITLVDVSFSDGATNFVHGSEYEVRIRTNNGSYRANLASAARLYVSLTNLSKADVVYRTGRMSAGTSETHLVEQRTLFDSALFTNPTIYFEATGLCADAGTRVFLRDHGTSDSGTGGSDVTGSGINFSSAAKIRVRSAAINPTAGDRFYARVAPSTSQVRLSHGWIVVQAQEQEFFDTHYVWTEGNNTPPYTTWTTAAHSIQDAIDVAAAGSTVMVRGGTFYENVDMKDGVDLVNDTSYTPVIDGGGIGSAVSFDGSFYIGCALDGFEITNGDATGGVLVHGTGAGLGNSIVITNCLVHGNTGPGIHVDGLASFTAPIIDNNQIYSNGEEGIYVVNAGSATTDAIIRSNTIYGHLTQAGINIGGVSYVTIGSDNIIHDNYAGIGFNVGVAGSGAVDIVDNQIYGNDEGGIGILDNVNGLITVTGNEIFQNTQGGIGIQNTCQLLIDRNDIYQSGRGGIHTGTDLADGGGFLGTVGSADLTVRRNKVHNNGGSGYGGGIDVRHGSGTIYNNLVYENHRGGIRFADYVTEIMNNTIVKNGVDGFGGGIIYDDLAGAVNAPPDGTIAISPNYPDPLIRNNISAFDEMAGLRSGYMPGADTVCPGNPNYTDGFPYRDFNLLYGNNGTTNDCGWDTLSPVRSCVNKNYGGCGLDNITWEKVNPDDIIADPLFVDMDNDNYQLELSSPARGTGYYGGSSTDMGAYDGPYPMDW